MYIHSAQANRRFLIVSLTLLSGSTGFLANSQISNASTRNSLAIAQQDARASVEILCPVNWPKKAGRGPVCTPREI